MARNCQHRECNDWVWTDDTQSIVWGIVGSKIISHDHPARPFSNDFIIDVGIIYLFLFFSFETSIFIYRSATPLQIPWWLKQNYKALWVGAVSDP